MVLQANLIINTQVIARAREEMITRDAWTCRYYQHVQALREGVETGMPLPQEELWFWAVAQASTISDGVYWTFWAPSTRWLASHSGGRRTLHPAFNIADDDGHVTRVHIDQLPGEPGTVARNFWEGVLRGASRCSDDELRSEACWEAAALKWGENVAEGMIRVRV